MSVKLRTASPSPVVGSMKRSLRLRSLLLFLFPAVILLCFGSILRRSLSPVPVQRDYLSLSSSALHGHLVRMAANDPGLAVLSRDVDALLSGDYFTTEISTGRNRSINLHLRANLPTISISASNIRFPIHFHIPGDFGIVPAFRRSLLHWSVNWRFDPEILTLLIRLIKNPLDDFHGRALSGKPYSSCAVVGNSGILLGSRYGKRIDGHDLVIRLNNARTDGYQNDVGLKTSFSFINSNILHLCSRKQGCFCQPYGDSVPIIMYACQASHFIDYVVCNFSHKAPLLVTDARFDALCARIVKYYSLKRFVDETGKHPAEWFSVHDERMFHYSSGMQAIMLALGICEQVSIFGFGKSKTVKHHYHTNQKVELALHDLMAEYAFYSDLVERPQAIPFLKDSSFKLPSVSFYT